MVGKEYPLVSVIVPVYNAQDYIGELLDSIVTQTYQNIEIIVVNDGSKDNSEQLVFEKLRKQEFIYINKENTGVSNSRNEGLIRATGEYVYFCDSDDCLEESMIEQLIGLVKQNPEKSMPTVRYTRRKGEFLSTCDSITKKKDRNDIVKTIIEEDGYLWNKLFIKNIIDTNNLRFSEEMDYFEDQFFLLLYAQYIEELIISNAVLYYYRDNASSVMNSKSINKSFNRINCYQEIVNFIQYSYPFLSRFTMERINELYCYAFKDCIVTSENNRQRKDNLNTIGKKYKNFIEEYPFDYKPKNVKLRVYNRFLKLYTSKYYD